MAPGKVAPHGHSVRVFVMRGRPPFYDSPTSPVPRDGRGSFLAGFRGGFSGDCGPAKNATFLSIQALAVDSSGNIYVADTGNRRIRKLTRHQKNR